MPKTAKIGRFPTSNGAVDNTTAQLIIISRYRVTDDPWPCNCIKDFFYRMIYILENAISKTHFLVSPAFLETFFWIFLITILYLICFYRSLTDLICHIDRKFFDYLVLNLQKKYVSGLVIYPISDFFHFKKNQLVWSK